MINREVYWIMVDAKLFVVFLVPIVLAGCSPRIYKIEETYKDVRLALDGRANDSYHLYSREGVRFSSAVPQSGTLMFNLALIPYPSTCLRVVDSKGEPVRLEGVAYEGFNIKLAPQHYELRQEEQNLIKNNNSYEYTRSQNQNSINTVSSDLSSNRAYVNTQCLLPPMHSIPEKPNTRCVDETQCWQDATQICFAIAFGAEGCSVALSREGVPGVVSGPSCGAVAANLAEQEYGMGDAIADAIQGVVDDWANSLMRDESWLVNIFGGAVKSLSYASKYDDAASCRNAFMSTHYGPYKAWEQEVINIESEPNTTLNSCTSLVEKLNKLYIDMNNIEKAIESNMYEISQVRQKREDLEKRSEFVNPGCIL